MNKIEENAKNVKNCSLLLDKPKALYEKTYLECIKWRDIRNNMVENYHSDKSLFIVNGIRIQCSRPS